MFDPSLLETPEARAAADTAEALFRKGATCSQAVVLTHAERLGLPTALVADLSLGLGGGVGRTREVCGSVTGFAMLAGIACGSGDALKPEAKKATYEAVQTFCAAFKERFGSCVCRELLALRVESAQAAKEHGGMPGERTPEYYKSRIGCIECIRFAAAAAASLRKAQYPVRGRSLRRGARRRMPRQS